MNRTRTVLVALGTWCAAVALVSTAVWVVIVRAGQGVVPVGDPHAAGTESLAVPHRHHDSKHPSHRRTSHAPSSRPTTPGTPSPTTSHSATTTPPSSQPSGTHSSTPAPPHAERRSWNGSAGHVVAECRASTARLVSAYPNTGWRYQVMSRGPGLVRVGFRRVGEKEGIEVTARCLSGAPHFSVSSWEPGDDQHE